MTTSPIKVLVVDDSADDAELMLLELRRAGYAPTAERVETAAEFWAVLARQAWDVILCDNSMPALDAQEALSLLQGAGLDVPLVVVSGTIGEERAVALMRAGAADFVMKGSLGRLAPAVEREARQGVERSKRRQAEREARDLAAIVASSTDAIVGKTLDGTVTSWNAAAERLYGYTAEEIVGHSILPLISPDRPDEEAELLGRVARGERVEHFETERVRRDGTRVQVSVSLSPVRDDTGRVVGASAIARDITRRKRQEEALRASEERLRLAAEASGFGAFNHDFTAGQTYRSAEFKAIFGLSPDAEYELAEDGLPVYIHPEDRSRVQAATQEVLDPCGPGMLELEHRLIRADDGATRWVLVRGRTTFAGEGKSRRATRFTGVVIDLTERRRAEAKLRASEQRYRTLVDATAAIVWDSPASGEFDSVQPEWTAFTGQTVEQHRAWGWLDVIHPDDREKTARAWAAAVTARTAYHVEHRIRRADGEYRHMTVRAMPILDESGAIREWVGVHTDVTEQRQAQEALHASEDRYRTLLERIPEPLFVYDRETLGYLAVNDAAVESYGYTRDEFLGMTIKDIRPAGDAPALLDMLARSRGGFEDRGVWRHRKKDGTMLDVEITAHDLSLDGRPACIILARDVTARRLADEAIRESEARYRSLADAMPQIVWATKPDGYHEFYNRQWYDYTGLTFGETEGEGWNAVFHPDDQPIAWDRWRHSLATGDPYEIEYRCRRHDGEYRWFLGRALPQRDADGKIVRWFGTCTDIHDFKQAQADRDAALARLDLQIQRLPLAYMVSDPDFRCTRWNPAAERTFGFTEAEVLGKLPSDVIVPPQSLTLVGDVLARLKAGDMDVHGMNENVTKDGRTIVCEWHNTPLFGPDGRFQGHIAIAQDVTARRVAEQALHLRDRAIQAVVGGILITDATTSDNPIIYVSPGFEHLTGYTAAEAIGRNCRFLQGKDTDPAVVAEVREAVRQGVPCDLELLNYRKDGTPFWNALSISPVHDDAGRLTHFIGVQTDVTDRRKLENQFHQAQKMEAVGQLAGGVAHDFNNLLTVINGYGEIVHDALPPGHSSRELVAQITRAGKRAAGLTRQLLAFSRQSVLEPKVLDANALIRDVERMLRRLIGEDIDLAAMLAPDLGSVKADPGQLEQAVVNLCVNARDAMPTGGKLTVETRNVELDATYAATHPDVRPGPYVLLSVSDTGTGMTPEVQARIFEPFFTTKEQGKGTGLGLAMVFGFVKQSGGHIAVYSELGRGTTFKLYFPRVGDAPLSSKSSIHRTLMPKGTETVLLVEDEDAVRALGRHVLAMCGYVVLEAGNGREAVSAADRHTGPLHLVVTDVVMPGGMGGRQVAETIVGRHPESKVLFTSGYADDAVVRHGVLDAGTHFLQKPFTPTTLAQKVRDVLDGKG